MKFAPIIDPAVRRPAPKPVRVDLRIVFGTGTLLWLIAAIVLAVLSLYDIVPYTAALVCVIGVAIGLMLLIWEHFDRWDYRRLGK